MNQDFLDFQNPTQRDDKSFSQRFTSFAKEKKVSFVFFVLFLIVALNFLITALIVSVNVLSPSSLLIPVSASPHYEQVTTYGLAGLLGSLFKQIFIPFVSLLSKVVSVLFYTLLFKPMVAIVSFVWYIVFYFLQGGLLVSFMAMFENLLIPDNWTWIHDGLGVGDTEATSQFASLLLTMFIVCLAIFVVSVLISVFKSLNSPEANYSGVISSIFKSALNLVLAIVFIITFYVLSVQISHLILNAVFGISSAEIPAVGIAVTGMFISAEDLQAFAPSYSVFVVPSSADVYTEISVDSIASSLQAFAQGGTLSWTAETMDGRETLTITNHLFDTGAAQYYPTTHQPTGENIVFNWSANNASTLVNISGWDSPWDEYHILGLGDGLPVGVPDTSIGETADPYGGILSCDMNHDGLIQYNELVGGDYPPEVLSQYADVKPYQSAVGVFNNTNSIYSKYRMTAISTAVANGEFHPPVLIVFISLLFICIGGMMIIYNLFTLSFKILGHIFLSPYGAALTPIDGGSKFSEWRGALFTDFAQLILYSLLFAVFLLVFASLDVLTDDFFDYLTDHSSILDRPPFGLDADSLKALIGSFYQVGIIIGAVYALTVLPATFGGVLGKIEALAGAGMLKKGMKVAVGGGAAVAAMAAKKASNRVATSKIGEASSRLKSSASAASSKAYRSSLGGWKGGKWERQANRAEQQRKDAGISLIDKNGNDKTVNALKREMKEAGINKVNIKSYTNQIERGQRDSNGDFDRLGDESKLTQKDVDRATKKNEKEDLNDRKKFAKQSGKERYKSLSKEEQAEYKQQEKEFKANQKQKEKESKSRS